MVKYYTLEEAAKVLRMSPDQLRGMANRKEIRAFQDRGTLRFRSDEVEERARAQGLSSSSEMEMGEAPATPAPKARRSVPRPADPKPDDEVSLGDEPPTPAAGPRSQRGSASTRPTADSDVRLVSDRDPDAGPRSPGPKSSVGRSSGPKSSVGRSSGPKSSVGPRSSGPKSSVGRAKAEQPSDSDVKLQPDDEEVQLGSPKLKSPSDSDIRLEDLPSMSGARKAQNQIVTEEIDLDVEVQKAGGAPSSRKSKLAKPKITPAAPPANKGGPRLPTASPFELSDSDLDLGDSTDPRDLAALSRPEIDSSSELEIPFDDGKVRAPGSDEIPLDDDAIDFDSLGGGKGASGINLGSPRDSGISLEGGGSDELEFDVPAPEGAAHRSGVDSSSEFELAIDGGADDGSSSEFELSVDDAPAEDGSSSEFELTLDDDGAAAHDNSDSEFELSLDDDASAPAGAESSESEFELTLDADGAAAAAEEEEGSSEFELTLDGGEEGAEGEEKDIFEPTNFEVPALDEESESEIRALDEGGDPESSEFTLDGDEEPASEEGGDELVDDEDAPAPAPKKGKAPAKLKAAAEDDEPVDDDDAAPARVKRRADEDDDEEVASAAPTAGSAPWGALPVILLFPTVIVMFLVGIMTFELTQGMWGYHRPMTLSKPVINTIARMFDDQLPKD